MPSLCLPSRNSRQKKLWRALVFAGLVATSAQAQKAPPRITAPPPPPSTPSASQSAPSTSNRSTFPGSIDVGPNPLEEGNATRMQHMREDERRKRLLTDAARLVALTSELHAEVEKNSREELSLDVVRKEAEIEKLAHDVRERMKN